MNLIVLDTTSKSLVASLAGAPSTQPDFASSYGDATATSFTEGGDDGVLNGVTEVTVVAAPAASTRRVIREITIYNPNASAVTLTVALANGASRRVIWKGTVEAGATWSLSSGTTSAYVSPFACNGRLTLTSGDPYGSVNVDTTATVYFCPFGGNTIALYNGTIWRMFTFTQLSLDITGYTANVNYDVFAYDNAGVVALTTVAWANAATRNTALVYQNGVLVRNGATGQRYVGTFRTSATGITTSNSVKRFVWNMYNKFPRSLYVGSAAAHSYAGNARLWNNTTTSNLIEWVTGLTQEMLIFMSGNQMPGLNDAAYLSVVVNGSTGLGPSIYDGTNTNYLAFGVTIIHSAIGYSYASVHQSTNSPSNPGSWLNFTLSMNLDM